MQKEEYPYSELIENLFAPFFERGFCYEYTYDKGSDSSCVYIYRFRKGKDYFDLRSVSGGKSGTFVVCSGGGFAFPNLKYRHKREFRAFALKHLFKKPSVEEKWAFAATLLLSEIVNGDFFGIKVQ